MLETLLNCKYIEEKLVDRLFYLNFYVARSHNDCLINVVRDLKINGTLA